jgi:23S rRNA pseudouridine2605 synthase
MRLQRYLAQCGVASRRAAEELILAGRVKVNGKVVRELGTKVDPEKDLVKFHGRPVKRPDTPEVWMLNKPNGIITTMRDPQQRRTVASLVHSSGRRLVPVGRLDANTTGLLLMTDDGDLALRLTHPRWGVEKDYLVTVEGTLNSEAKKLLREGVALDGRPVAVEKLTSAQGVGPARQGCSRWRVVVHEGRRHLIRRLMEAVGYPVHGLHRERVGPIELGQLASGQARRLTDEEHAALRAAVGLDSH